MIQVIQISTDPKNKLNTLGVATRKHLYTSLVAALENDAIPGIVVTGNHQHFSAGADLTEFSSLSNDDTDVPSLVELCHFIEESSKPIVAAICGVALGGGCEVALACHYRISSTTAKIGLPEVNVGVIPGAGGTQRMPRLIGLQRSMQLITSGIPLDGKQALKVGLVDAVPHDQQSLLDCAKSWAEWATLLEPSVLPRTCGLTKHTAVSKQQVESIVTKYKKKLPPIHRGGEGVHAALDAIHASFTCQNFKEGMNKEGELFYQTLAGLQGQARRHAFFATRAAQKINLTNLPRQHLLLQPNKHTVQVGVIGGGTMGSGIALVLLLAGFQVWLVDVQPPALEKGLAHIHKTMETMVKKGKLSNEKLLGCKKQLKGTMELRNLSDCHLIVEAVVENLRIKQSIFTKLDQIVKDPSALLLSNTSTLDIQAIASVVSARRQSCCAGWHFFSPAHVMKLVEIVVVPNQTSPGTVALLQALSKTIGKIAVVVGNCDGFVGNRMLHPYTSEMVLLLVEGRGTSVQDVDKAMQLDFGMAIGPFVMSDLAGNDIGYFIRKEKGLVRDPKTNQVGPNRKPGMRYTELADDMVTQLKRVGQKAGKGWYDYVENIGKGRKPLPSVQVDRFIEKYVNPSVSRQKPLSSEEIVERIVFPLVNEGFKILEEGIASKPSDIDVVYLYGYGWPAWRGGPMFWADNEVGLSYLLKTLEQFHAQYPTSSYYEPSNLLKECVTLGVTVQEYYQKGLHRNKTNYSKL